MYDKKDPLLKIHKSNSLIVEITHYKPQETLEFQMNKPNKIFFYYSSGVL